jgi:pyruvate ferredoxin oxidoreductase delta subunit
MEKVGIEDREIKSDIKKIPVSSPQAQEPAKVNRVFRPKINLQACNNSYNCVIYCPHDAIRRNEKGKPVIDYNICTGCLICLRECPTNAITEEKEVK